MEDFTGGLTETFNLGSETPAHLFQIMQKAMQRQSLMGCNIKVSMGGWWLVDMLMGGSDLLYFCLQQGFQNL